MVRSEEVGCKVEGIFNFVPNVVNLLLTGGSRRWYVVRAYMPPNYVPNVYRVEQVLEAAPRGLEFILLGNLNLQLRELRDAQVEELSMVVADCGLVDMIYHFISRRQYRGDGLWTWRMRRYDRQVMGQGDYIHGTNMHKIFNTGVMEARLHIDHQMVLVVLQGEGELQNRS